MTTISGRGKFIEIGDLEMNGEPGIRIRRPGGDLVIFGLTREEVKSVGEHFLNEVSVTIDLKSCPISD